MEADVVENFFGTPVGVHTRHHEKVGSRWVGGGVDNAGGGNDKKKKNEQKQATFKAMVVVDVLMKATIEKFQMKMMTT